MFDTDTELSRSTPLPYYFRLVLAAICGALGAMAHAPFDIAAFVLAPVLAGFALTSAHDRRARAFWIGSAIGLGYFACVLRWVLEPFQIQAEIYAWMAPFALILLAVGLSLIWGTAFALSAARGPVAIAITWALAELVRAYLFTGFPWGGFAQTLLGTPFAFLLAYVGPHGLTMLLLLSVAIACSGLARAFLMVGISLAFAVLSPRANDVALTEHVIRIVQPNAAQHEKWDPDLAPRFVRRQIDYSAMPGSPDLVLWPETAIPYVSSVAGPIFEQVAVAARGVPVVMGLIREGEDGRFYNSAALIDATGTTAQSYDKHHLVPFGEYMPFPGVFRWLRVRGLAERANTGYASGPGPRLLDFGPMGRALVLICYEAVFAHDARAAERPEFLVQLTNDAWFGTESGPQQHLAQARMRAMEQGVPLVRSANTGISAMIDPYGQVREFLPLDEAGYIDAVLPAPLAPTLYSRLGDWPVAVLLLLLNLGAFFHLLLSKRAEER